MKEARQVINTLFGEIQHTVLSVLDQYKEVVKNLTDENNKLMKNNPMKVYGEWLNTTRPCHLFDKAPTGGCKECTDKDVCFMKFYESKNKE